MDELGEPFILALPLPLPLLCALTLPLPLPFIGKSTSWILPWLSRAPGDARAGWLGSRNSSHALRLVLCGARGGIGGGMCRCEWE